MTDHQLETWENGTEVVAQYSFKGNSSEDLPFKRGDILTILKATRDPMWYLAKNQSKDKEGMIPANYVVKRQEVTLHAMPWFHGKIPREKAEDLLRERMEDGLFLVRESTNYPGDFTLCVCFDSKIDHYHVSYKKNKLTIDDDCFYDTLTELVQAYEKDANGLCTRLTKPVKKQGKQELFVDKKEFEYRGWVIKERDIEFVPGEDFLGRGDFGEVKKGKYRGQDVAVKFLQDSNQATHSFLAEASVMTALRHPNLVQLIGIVLGSTINIVTEFMSKGSLVDYLRTRGRAVISKKDQINFASDTCSGMEYLELKKVIHRDLAARNVLIAEDGTAKVSDFGLAKSEDANQSGGKFPIKWTAPEALRESKFTSKSDMWSFGILLWEIYSFGRVPYPRIPLASVVQHVENGYRMEPPDGCPAEVSDIMSKAWNIKPDLRPTFADINKVLKHLRETTT